MKTRQELLIDFMLQLASNPAMIKADLNDKTISRDIFLLAAELAQKVLDVQG